MKEKELREQIKKEAKGYKTSFDGIDTLMRYEDDYHTANKEGNYDFSSCPHSYECMGNFGVIDLCETDSGILDSVEECRECWRMAFKKAELHE